MNISEARALLGDGVRPGSYEDFALKRAEERISDGLNRRQAFAVLCHVAEIPEPHAGPHADRAVQAGGGVGALRRMFADMGLRGDHATRFERAARHIRQNNTVDDLTRMALDHLGLLSKLPA